MILTEIKTVTVTEIAVEDIGEIFHLKIGDIALIVAVLVLEMIGGAKIETEIKTEMHNVTIVNLHLVGRIDHALVIGTHLPLQMRSEQSP
ncbi:hypothetical protein, partial [Salmonella sp. s51228]|uniref:hypothetical protein n=1 Tax=Salmonella sp. s51228 TaxID=3159652 RepID=UPI00397FDA88